MGQILGSLIGVCISLYGIYGGGNSAIYACYVFLGFQILTIIIYGTAGAIVQMVKDD